MSLTRDIDVHFKLLVAAAVQHFAAKGCILVLARWVEGQVVRGRVVPIWSLFAFDLVGRPYFLPGFGPGESDRRRVEAICTAAKMAFCFQHHPLLRHRQRGGSYKGKA